MAKAYDDDLRRKFLSAYDRGEGTIPELSSRFGVSVAWGWVIRPAFLPIEPADSPANIVALGRFVELPQRTQSMRKKKNRTTDLLFFADDDRIYRVETFKGEQCRLNVRTQKRTGKKLTSLDEAAKAMQWLQEVGAGDTPDAVNARIVEGIIRGLQRVCELQDGLQGRQN